MPVYRTTFEVNAPASRVWQVLTALDCYDEWNPQIPKATGTLEEGATIHLRLALPGRPPMGLSATIEQAVPELLLTWRGHVLAAWLFEGYRRFAIRPIAAGKVSVTHVEDIHGLMAPAFALLMGGPVQRSHQALNHALRARAESR